MPWRKAATVLMALGSAPTAFAGEKLPIDSSFGTESGCLLARTNNYSEDDTVRLLTPEGLQTMVSGCTFTKVTTLPDAGFEVSLACGEEGSGTEDNHESSAKITGNTQTGYKVAFADGTQWELMKKCQ